MNNIESQNNILECAGVRMLGWKEADCPSPDPGISDILKYPSCLNCSAFLCSKIVAVAAEAEALKEEVSELQKDPLTGLLTRRAFQEEFEDYRADGRPFAIIFLDVEKFSSYNDRYGHQGGDVILASIGDAFANNIRQTDALALVEEKRLDGHVSRRGGDELVLMIDLQDPAGFSDEDFVDNRATDFLSVEDRAQRAKQRIELEFPGWFSESLENLQTITGVPKNQRIETKIEFHLDMVVSDVGDTRSLEDLIHLADPDKFKNKRGPVPDWYPNAKALNGVFNFVRSKIRPNQI